MGELGLFDGMKRVLVNRIQHMRTSHVSHAFLDASCDPPGETARHIANIKDLIVVCICPECESEQCRSITRADREQAILAASSLAELSAAFIEPWRQLIELFTHADAVVFGNIQENEDAIRRLVMLANGSALTAADVGAGVDLEPRSNGLVPPVDILTALSLYPGALPRITALNTPTYVVPPSVDLSTFDPARVLRAVTADSASPLPEAFCGGVHRAAKCAFAPGSSWCTGGNMTVFGFVARFAAMKGVTAMFAAAARMTNIVGREAVRFVLVGRAPYPSFMAALLEVKQRFGITDDMVRILMVLLVRGVMLKCVPAFRC